MSKRKFKKGDKVRFVDGAIPWADKAEGTIEKCYRSFKGYDVQVTVYENEITVATFRGVHHDEEMELIK